MQYRRLGRTGLKVSAIGLGTNSFGRRADRETARAILERAVDAGVTLIDTANLYGGGASEEIIGWVLRTTLRSRRDELVLATKAGLRVAEGPDGAGASRRHLMRQVERSLRRLGVDAIDLYQVHSWDPETPLEETLATLDALVRAGKVRYIGASNYRAWEAMKALAVSDAHHFVRYQSLQLSYSLADRTVEREVLPFCRSEGLGLIAYLPLAGGVLTGKYRGGEVPAGSRAAVDPRYLARIGEHHLALAETVRGVAAELGWTPSQVALAWLLRRQEVSSAIVGAARPWQVVENVAAADLVLPEEASARLEEASEPFRWAKPFAEYRLAGD